MLHLIETESPRFDGMDIDGLMHLNGPKFRFVHMPFGQIVATNKETDIQYGAYAHEFTLMYDGICAERDFL